MKKIPFTLRKEYIAKIVIEVFSVVFAVLLALGLNEWRKIRADEAMGVKVVKNIITEINDNKDNLGTILPKHDTTLFAINKVIENYKTNEHLTGFELSGLTMELLSSKAWDAIKATETINLIDIKYIIKISAFMTCKICI